MRISDWSSDVCSSDRIAEQNLNLYLAAVLEATLLPPPMPEADWRETMDRLSTEGVAAYRGDRKSVGKGKRVSVRVDVGGRRIIKKKTIQQYIQRPCTEHRSLNTKQPSEQTKNQ